MMPNSSKKLFNPMFQVFRKKTSQKIVAYTQYQDFLNGPVKDCVSQSYTNRFKTKRRFITKNVNVAKLDSFIYCNP